MHAAMRSILVRPLLASCCAVCQGRNPGTALLPSSSSLSQFSSPSSSARCLATGGTTEEAPVAPPASGQQPQAYELTTKFVYRGPEGVDPSDTTYILFPGQASQFVGMGGRLLKYPRAKEVYDQASHLLKYDLIKLCLEGPERKLAMTQFSQPAIFVTSIAAMLALEETYPDAVPKCIGTAGYSVGELAAHTFAGTFSFEEGLRLVQIRAQAMQEACDQSPGGMTICTLGPDSNVGKARQAAVEHCRSKLGFERPVCSVASYLYAKCIVLGGHKEAMQYLQEHHAKFGILSCKPLAVSGAFHTDLMYPAGKSLSRALNRCTLRLPRIPVYSNVSVKAPRTLESITKLLVKQVYSPVKWHQIVMSLTRRPPDAPHPRIFEVGPGQQIGYMLQKINNKAYQSYASIPV